MNMFEKNELSYDLVGNKIGLILILLNKILNVLGIYLQKIQITK